MRDIKLILVLGGSGSGKSAYAENRIRSLAGNTPICYLATMQADGAEGQKKIERHRALRAGKGFFTIEKQKGLKEVAGRLQEEHPDCQALLLECMTNLVANEMFTESGIRTKETVVWEIMEGIDALSKVVSTIVVVTGNVFEDGIEYEASTMEYIRALGEVNRKLAIHAVEVTELVVGIPVRIKG